MPGAFMSQQPLKLYLTSSDGKDIFSEADQGFTESTWVAGKTYPMMSVFHLPLTIPPGKYDIRIALVDTSGKPSIRLGIAGEDGEHRYKLGEIQILPSDAPKVCLTNYC